MSLVRRPLAGIAVLGAAPYRRMRGRAPTRRAPTSSASRPTRSARTPTRASTRSPSRPRTTRSWVPAVRADDPEGPARKLKALDPPSDLCRLRRGHRPARPAPGDPAAADRIAAARTRGRDQRGRPQLDASRQADARRRSSASRLRHRGHGGTTDGHDGAPTTPTPHDRHGARGTGDTAGYVRTRRPRRPRCRVRPPCRARQPRRPQDQGPRGRGQARRVRRGDRQARHLHARQPHAREAARRAGARPGPRSARC